MILGGTIGNMVKVYYCSICNKIYYISGNKNAKCNICGNKCFKLKMGYAQYTSMESRERQAYLDKIKKDYKG